MRRGTDPARDITVSWRRIGESTSGSIYAIKARGHYPQGSQGFPHSEEIRKRGSKLIEQEDPAAILFDFSELKYRWGDSIAGALISLMVQGRQETGDLRVVSI